jgi:hypothetical protein
MCPPSPTRRDLVRSPRRPRPEKESTRCRKISPPPAIFGRRHHMRSGHTRQGVRRFSWPQSRIGPPRYRIACAKGAQVTISAPNRQTAPVLTSDGSPNSATHGRWRLVSGPSAHPLALKHRTAGPLQHRAHALAHAYICATRLVRPAADRGERDYRIGIAVLPIQCGSGSGVRVGTRNRNLNCGVRVQHVACGSRKRAA